MCSVFIWPLNNPVHLSPNSQQPLVILLSDQSRTPLCHLAALLYSNHQLQDRLLILDMLTMEPIVSVKLQNCQWRLFEEVVCGFSLLTAVSVFTKGFRQSLGHTLMPMQ